MIGQPSHYPIAVRLGFVHVSVAPATDGWVAMMWGPACGPTGISPVVDYCSAVDRARAYAALDPCRILDLPDGEGDTDGRGFVHVVRAGNGKLEVLHESASGESFATLAHFDASNRKRCIRFALAMLDEYRNAERCRSAREARMGFLNLNRERRALLDLDAIRREHSLPDVVGAVVPLKRVSGELVGCCPFHSERSPSFTIYAGGQRWHCFGCGLGGDVLDFVQRAHGLGLRDAADLLTGGSLPVVVVAPLPVDDGPDRSEEARAIWSAALPISGTLAETYLRNRSLHLPLPDCLRFASLRYGKSGPEHPVLVSAIASADNRIAAIQRTYLATDGKGKASVPKAKLSLGRVSGGAIRLGACARSLVVCEGLEDGLTLMQEMGRTVWVSAGAGNLHKMQFPQGVEAVAIGGDNDATGEREARKAAQAFAERGIEARCFFPLPGCKDFNAELMEGDRA